MRREGITPSRSAGRADCRQPRDAGIGDVFATHRLAGFGGVKLNGTLLHGAKQLPFGGVCAGGIGACHGRQGFKRFNHARAVHLIGFVNMFELLRPLWAKIAKAPGTRQSDQK